MDAEFNPLDDEQMNEMDDFEKTQHGATLDNSLNHKRLISNIDDAKTVKTSH